MSYSYQAGSTAKFIFAVDTDEPLENPSVTFSQGDDILVLSDEWCEVDAVNRTVTVIFTEDEGLLFEDGEMRVQLSLGDSVRSSMHVVPVRGTILGELYVDEDAGEDAGEEDYGEEDPEEEDVSEMSEEGVPEDYDVDGDPAVIDDEVEPEPEVDPDWYDESIPITNDIMDLDGEYIEPEFIDDEEEKEMQNDDSDPIFDEEDGE